MPKYNSEAIHEVMNSIHDALFIHDLTTGKIVHVNRQVSELYGYSFEEVLNLSLGQLSLGESPYSQKEADQWIQKAIDEGEQVFEWIGRKKNDEVFWAEIILRCANIEKNPIIIVAVRNIELRKKAELDLRKSEERFRILMEQAVDGIFLGDSEGKFIGVNSIGAEMTGYSQNELMKMNMGQLFTEEEKKRTPLRYDLLNEGKVVVNQRELKRKDGTSLFIEMHTKMMPDKTYQSFFRDITACKKSEEVLRESEEKYRLIFEYSPLGLLSFDEKGVIIACNDIFVQIIGSSREKLIGLNMLNLPDKYIVSAVQNALNGSIGSYEGVYSSVTANKVTPARIIFAPMKIGGGSVFGGVGIIEDISERKKSEEAFKESEERYSSLFLSAAEGILVTDIETKKFIYANPPICSMLGYSEEEITELGVMDIHPKESIEEIMQVFEAQTRGEIKFAPGLPCLRKDGAVIFANINASDIILNKRKCIVGFFTEVTELKQTEDALRKSEEKFRILTEKSPVGIYIMQQDGLITYANPSALKMFGYSSEEVIGIFSIKDLIHPDEVPFLMKKLQERLEGKTDISNPFYKAIKKDGSFIYVEIFGLMIDYQGKPAVMGTLINITERKQAEEALLESEKQVRRKLDVILSPETNINALELSDIIDCEKIQKLMDKFYQLTNIGMAIIDLKGKVLVGTGWQDICTNFHRINAETCQLCVESDLELSRNVPVGTFKQYRCKNNMWDMASPIYLGGTLMGNFFLGQFLFDDETPDYETFRQQARKYGFNEEKYISALDRVPRWSHKTVDAVMSFYTAFAEIIGNLSYANVKLASTLEERKRAEKALTESEEIYRSIFENTGTASIIIEEDTTIALANAEWVSLSGYSREENEGKKKWTEFVVPEDLERMKEYHRNRRVDELNAPRKYEFRFIRKNGEIRNMTNSVTMIPGTKRSIASLTDMTERIRAEEALRESEEKYRSVIESAPVGIFIIKDELIQYVNPAMYVITGYTEQDVIGQHFLNFVAKKYQEIEKQFYVRRMKGEVFPSSYETGAIVKNGKEIPVDLTVSTFYLLGEKAEMVFVRDISARKEAERILLQKKQELDSIYNTVGDMVFQLEVEEGNRFRFNSVNRTFENYTGLNASMVVGKLINEIIPKPFLSINIKKCHEAIKQKAIVRWEETSQFPIGMLTCEYSVAPVFDIDGICTHIVGSVHDITERKMIEDRIKKLNEELEDRVKTRTKQLEEVNKELEAFSYSVSHDLRAPLRAINGFTRILHEDYSTKIDAEGKRICRVIQNEATRMGQLIDDLLSFSRLSRSTMQTTIIDMKELVHQVFFALLEQNKSKEIDFILNDLPEVDGDLNLLRQVWLNLLSNAIKFTSKKEKPRIEISYKETPNEIIFSIKDNGAGFDMTYVNKLFGVFQRLHNQEEFDGTGVGLAIVQRIIYRHGGRVWAEAAIDHGATFYFSLPIKNKSL